MKLKIYFINFVHEKKKLSDYRKENLGREVKLREERG